MIRIPGISSIFARQTRVNFLLSSLMALAVLCAARANAQTVATYDFEDGTAQGWASFNGASVPVATTAAAYSGSHSLLTTTGSSGQGGPSINVTGILLKVTATNGNVGTAYATQLNGFTLTQTSGPKCTPKVTAGSTPVLFGDLAPGATASASFTVSIIGCDPLASFTLSVPWSSAVYDTGTFVTNLNFNRGN